MNDKMTTSGLTRLTLQAIVKMCRTEHDNYSAFAKMHHNQPEVAKQYYVLADHWWNEYLIAKKKLFDFEQKLQREA